MNTPSQQARIEIWRYVYARSSLIEARDAAKCLIAGRTLPDQVKRAILCQIVVAYARPFTNSYVTNSRRIVLLANNEVPAAFQALHKELQQMRDRTIGHKDAVAFPSVPVNKVVVHVYDADFELRTVSLYDMGESVLQQTVNLCDDLINHCALKLQEYRSHFNGVGKGDYVLSIEADPVEWLVKQD